MAFFVNILSFLRFDKCFFCFVVQLKGRSTLFAMFDFTNRILQCLTYFKPFLTICNPFTIVVNT